MRKILSLSFVLAVILILAIMFACVSVNGITAAASHDATDFVPNEVIVCFNEVVSVRDQNSVIKKHGGTIAKRNEALNSVLVIVEDESAFIGDMRKASGVKYAERNGIVHAISSPSKGSVMPALPPSKISIDTQTRLIPNDPRWDDQWGPQSIYCPEAWDLETGDTDVVIAIVDTGMDYHHEDLTNYKTGGYDWVNYDSDPFDDNDHGTHCAGIAAATMDNAKGIAGVAQVSFIAEKVLSADGSGSYYSCSQGITHAVDHCGADVVSMSFGGSFYSTELEAACQYAWDKGAVLVAAAGNSGDTTAVYPAWYEAVICVGSIDESDFRSYFSCYGPSMELVAPGENILSTIRDNDYASGDGTSMATPHVAGVAALVMSYSGASNSELRTILQNTANDLGAAGWDQYYGYGKVDAYAAVNPPPVYPVMSYSPASHNFGSMQEGKTDSTSFVIGNSGADTLYYSLSEACGWVEVNPTSGSSTGEPDTITVDIDTTGLSDGTHTADITINSNGGSGTFTVTVNVAPEASWTFMVFLDGDNNLEGAAIDDFMEMSSAGTSAGVNIVAQFDRIPGYDGSYGDWTTCKRFRITPGMTPTAANAIADLGECNMGDPNTLTEFVEWSMTEYPAENYALILWNHGSGWKLPVPWVETKGICWDDTSNDHLTLQETGQALSGRYVDLLGNDACLMQMIEVAYQVRASAGIIVGSEETEPWDGWPYDTILNDLISSPTMTPSTFGETIVSRYIEYYPYEALSAMNNSELPDLATAMDNFAQVLIGKLTGNYNEIKEARTKVQDFYDYDYIDLYHFAELIKSYVPGAESAAQAVMDNLSSVVYADAHGLYYQNAHGLTLYYPELEWAYASSYDTTAFAIDTHWDEFLKKYYAPPICGNMVVDPTSWSPTLFCGNTDTKTVNVSASGGIVEGVTVSKVSGPTWLSVNTTDLGDIAPDSCKTFSMSASPPSGTSGDFPYTITVNNTCGSPSSTYVNGTIAVLCEGLRVRLEATCDSGTDVAEFGVNGNATDGFDLEFDIPEPPAPPPPYQQAYFYYPENPLVKKLSTSYIPNHFFGSVERNSWPFQLDYSGDGSNVTITWNADDIAAVPGINSLLFVVNGEHIDMRTTPSYTFSATTGTYEYEIIAMTAGQYTFELFTGWNMVSLPVEPLDKDADNIFGPDYYGLYAWDPITRCYITVGEVETNVGYWLFVLEDRSVTVTGTPIYEYQANLIGGWNMIGSIWTTTNVPLGTETVPPEQMYPYLYTWCVDHYDVTQVIDPGVGYWALTYGDCELCVSPTLPSPPFQQSRQIPRGFNDWRVIGEDNAELGQKDAATDGIDTQFDVPMPPSPP